MTSQLTNQEKATPNEKQIRDTIASLPDTPFGFEKMLLERLLEKKGAEGFITFVDDMNRLIEQNKSGMVASAVRSFFAVQTRPRADDLSADERAVVRSLPPGITRRTFMGLALGGVGLGVGADMAATGSQDLKRYAPQTFQHNQVKARVLSGAGVAAMGVGFASVQMADGLLRSRLEVLCNAVKSYRDYEKLAPQR